MILYLSLSMNEVHTLKIGLSNSRCFYQCNIILLLHLYCKNLICKFVDSQNDVYLHSLKLSFKSAQATNCLFFVLFCFFFDMLQVTVGKKLNLDLSYWNITKLHNVELFAFIRSCISIVYFWGMLQVQECVCIDLPILMFQYLFICWIGQFMQKWNTLGCPARTRLGQTNLPKPGFKLLKKWIEGHSFTMKEIVKN